MKKITPHYALEKREGRFVILRNARPLMTPKGKLYAFGQEDLARAVMKEWQAQQNKLNTKTMPLTQLAATAFDIVSFEKEKTVSSLVAFTQTELLCHRAEGSQSLIARQDEIWGRVLSWCEQRYGVCFVLTAGVIPMPQKDELAFLLEKEMSSYDDLKLTGVRQAADAAGSLVLALAMAEGYMNAQSVFEAAELESLHQSEKWGIDPIEQARRDEVKFDLEAVQRWFQLGGRC